MYRRSIFVMMALNLLLNSTCAAESVAPTGWRFPTDKDRSGDWRDARDPYVVRADFNGDGLQDEAWILLRKAGKTSEKMNATTGGLFVFLAQPNQSSEPRLLSDINYPQYMGVAVARPGDYETACGKGFACGKLDPTHIKLIYPGINLFKFESANSFFVWDADKRDFRRYWMSD